MSIEKKSIQGKTYFKITKTMRTEQMPRYKVLQLYSGCPYQGVFPRRHILAAKTVQASFSFVCPTEKGLAVINSKFSF